jgi:hypothetical protein
VQRLLHTAAHCSSSCRIQLTAAGHLISHKRVILLLLLLLLLLVFRPVLGRHL